MADTFRLTGKLDACEAVKHRVEHQHPFKSRQTGAQAQMRTGTQCEMTRGVPAPYVEAMCKVDDLTGHRLGEIIAFLGGLHRAFCR